ncbi:Proteinase-activated receptor 1 [Varanus komodoensis]|nr:Proteinase-activated receptor 1 [Varanus komodoensis]
MLREAAAIAVCLTLGEKIRHDVRAPDLVVVMPVAHQRLPLIHQSWPARLSQAREELGVEEFAIKIAEAGVENSSGEHKPKGLLPIATSKDIEKYLTDPWLTNFVPTIEILVFTLGLPLNIMAILIFVVKTKLNKPAVVYMFSLASADVLCVSVLPLKIIYHYSGNHWAFGREVCGCAVATFYCNMYCSILLMTVISIDRFLAVVYPMQSLSWRTVRRASVVSAAIWLVAIAGVIPLLINDLTQEVPQLNITTCYDALQFSLVKKTFHYYYTALSVMFFFIPLLISTTCYVCIIRKLAASNVAGNLGKKKHAILLTSAVLCSFIACFGPTHVMLLMQDFWPDEQLEHLYVAHLLCLCAGTLNCCIDPLIYYYASSEFQKQCWNLLCQRKHSAFDKDLRRKHSSTTTFS